MKKTNLLVLLFLFTAVAGARPDRQTCGSYPGRAQEEMFFHRRAMAAAAAKPATLRAAPNRPASRDAGNIVIMDDTGVVSRRNAFNLDRRFVLFRPTAPQAAQYTYESGPDGFDANLSDSGAPLTGLDDDDTRELALPFSFRFYGQSYTRLFVNSDGNLTFGAGDPVTADRSIGRMTSGSPRISPFYADLDPSRAGSVRVASAADRVTISWRAVPEYRSFGTGPLNSLQVSLFPDGRIQLAWEGVQSSEAVVGIAPGSLQGASALVSLSAADSRAYSGAIIEGFSSVEAVDIVLAAQKFYETHEDAYDYLVVYNNLGIPASAGAVAFEVTVRSDREGIGDVITDAGREFGSAKRLQAMLNLGPLNQYPVDPNAVVPSRSASRDTPLTVLGHEAGHLWLAFVSVRDPANPDVLPMLGRQTAHWAFNFNSEASLLEGNRIRDNGPGVTPRFTTTATVEGYSPLDQYLMGFRNPQDVSPFFYVGNPSIGNASRQPQSGISFDGERRDVSIGELIAETGIRRPDHTVSQRRFRLAFLLIAKEGTEPTAAEMAQLEGYRAGFESFFARASGSRATASTSLVRNLRLSVFPAAGVVTGGTIPATVSIGAPAESPITVLLRTGGLAAAPASVTIPAGSTSAAFDLRGVRPGVDDLEAAPSDTRYGDAHARIQVLDQASSLRIAIAAGDKQPVSGAALNPVTVRISDANKLPYPGVELIATPSGGGSVQTARALTDENGEARFTWTPGPGPLHELRIALAASPAIAITATALGRPTISANGIVNAASYTPGLAPGGIASIFGASMAGGSNQLAAVRVLVNGSPATPIYVSDRQINFIAPSSIEPGEAEVVVTTPLGTTNRVRVPVRAVDPGIFGILPIGAAVAPGEFIEIYATGMGAVRDGSTVTPAEVSIGGINAEVLFSGPAPGFPGLYQVNARVPAGLAAGSREVIVRQSTAASNAFPIRIR